MIRRELNENGNTFHFMLMEAGEIKRCAQEGRKWLDFQNNMWHISIDKFMQQVVVGEQGYVSAADDIMRQLENEIVPSRAWRAVDDVVGALPNVPAFLAGTPQNMRRRVRVDKETAPLTIYMDLATSAGIPAQQVLKRGVVLLALARLLIEHRPVELWVGAMLDDSGWKGKCATAAWRIDTAPLDLARAAFQMADVSMSRLFGYAMCETMTNCHLGGRITHESIERQKRQLCEVAGWQQMVYIPAMFLRDEMVTRPVEWIKRELARLTKGGGEEDGVGEYVGEKRGGQR